MRIHEIMTSDVINVTPETKASVAWQRMRDRDIHHLVVIEDGDVVGVVSSRDLGGAHGEKVRAASTVSDLMTPSVVSVAPEATVRQAANLLRGRTIGCLPVMARGKVVGIVTTTDLLNLIGRGSEAPHPRGQRWTLRDRGPRKRAAARADGQRPS